MKISINEETTLLKLPFNPDYVTYTAYKFELCELCKNEKDKDDSFDSTSCIHCKNKTRTLCGAFCPKKEKNKVVDT